MPKEKLAIDIDDVLADSTDALRLFVNQRRGVDLSEEHYRIEARYWGYYESVWEQHGIDPVDLMHDFHGGMNRDQSNIRPIPGSVEVTKRLAEKYYLIPITSRPEEMKDETERYLQNQFDPVFAESPIFLGFGPAAKHTKGEVCEERGISYLLDDNVDHCKTALALGVGAILFGNYGWQQALPEELPRCKDWREVEGFFDVAG